MFHSKNKRIMYTHINSVSLYKTGMQGVRVLEKQSDLCFYNSVFANWSVSFMVKHVCFNLESSENQIFRVS